MKKIVVLCFVLMATVAVQAQVYVGGALGFWQNNDKDLTSFEFAPEVGYELNENWSVGAALAFAYAKQDKGEFNYKERGFAFAPYARYTFLNSKVVRLFVDGCIGVSSYKLGHLDSEAGFEIGLKPGLALKLDKHFSFVTKFGFLGFRDEYLGKGNDGYGFGLKSEDLSIGFHYEF